MKKYLFILYNLMLICQPKNEVVFKYVPGKLMISSLKLSNNSQQYLAYKIKGTNLKAYKVLPVLGLISKGGQQRVDFHMGATVIKDKKIDITDMFQVNYFFT